MFKHEHAPLCQNSSCKIYKCQFSHTVPVVDESDSDSDSDDYTLDNECDQAEASTNKNPANKVRCDYGLCDFQQILFNTKSDLKIHLRPHHGMDR